MKSQQISQIIIDPERTVGDISPEIYGGFLEHIGRAIYEGIYEPGSPLADERGFRRDVLAALQKLGPTIIRYPGGNFLSGYHWIDGVGPKEQRPRRRELAWHSIETNQFGMNEFVEYCQALHTIPMLGVNLGTGTLDEAAAQVEYCNAPPGSFYSDLRASHGYPQPHNVKTWCLGNEMDGPWQIGHLEAEAYGLKAREAAKMMKWQDPTLRLVLCGSSSTGMPTYPEWDRTALEICWEHVDYLSLHYYANNDAQDSASYLALARQFEDHLDTLAATLRYVGAKLRSKRQVYLSWDEWNVWYKDRTSDGHWSEAPHLVEEIYNLEDALVVAQWMNVFLRRCNVLKIACLAQLVNVIAPILTRPNDLLIQPTYYPFQLFRHYGQGQSLDLLCKSPEYETAQFGPQPQLDCSASHDPATNATTLFVVNRNLTAATPVEIAWRTGDPGAKVRLVQLAGNDPKAANTFEHPDLVKPVDLGWQPVVDGRMTINLPALSFTVITNQA